MKKAILLLTVVSSLAYAQNSTTTSASTAAEPTAQLSTTVATPPSWTKSIILGYKSYNDTGRFGYIDQTTAGNPKDPRNAKDAWQGVQYKGKHEAKLGYRHSSGWGSFLQMTQYRYDYSTDRYSKWSVSDPSISLIHPTLYDDGELKVTGFVRYYFPLTDRSRFDGPKGQGITQVAYYLDSVAKLAHGAEFFNEFNPRSFAMDTYKDYDARYKVEDLSSYTVKAGNWGRWGVGQWTQYEQHANSPQGLTVDVIPQLDVFIDSTKTYFGPRVYLPVFVKDSVYDAAKAAALDNAYFELYFQANL